MNECTRCGKTGIELRASCFNCFAPLELTPEETELLRKKLEERRALLLAVKEDDLEDREYDDTSRMEIVGEIFDDLEEVQLPWWKKLFAQKNENVQQKHTMLQGSDTPKKVKKGIKSKGTSDIAEDEDRSLVDDAELKRRMQEAKEREEQEKKEKARLEKERKKREKENKKNTKKRDIRDTILEDDVPVELLRSAINAAINTMEANTTTDFGDILTSYLKLNQGQQKQIFGELYNNFNIIANPQGYGQLVNSGLARYSKAVQSDVSEANTIIEFINRFGYGNNYFNAASISYFAEQRNFVAATHLLKFLLRTYPFDSVMHAELYNVVDNMQGQVTPPIKRTMKEAFLTELAPQYARRYRHRYFSGLAFSQNPSDKEQLAVFEKSSERLTMADFKLANNDNDGATRLFYDIAVNSAEMLNTRLAAFSGLTDSSIKDAVSVIPYITDAIVSQIETPAMVGNIRWFGLEIGKMMVKLASNEADHPNVNPADAYITGANALSKLINANQTACLKGENHNGKSLRQSAALVYALAGMEREMNEIIDRRIEYRDFPIAGTETGATYQELAEQTRFISPNYTEADAIRSSVRVAMAQYKSAK